MLNYKLHIVSFDIPFPPNYGGIIDVFYKIKALSELGVEIYLHTFEYKTERSEELDKICKKVYYYPRLNSFKKIFSSIPYIANTRKNKQLLINLRTIDAPILFEGLHTTYPLLDTNFNKRKVLIRTHNIEHFYYKGLAKSETNIFKKLFFISEAKKLKSYEKILKKINYILTISDSDNQYFKKTYKTESVYIPVFHSNKTVKNLTAKGSYALYHGDLSVSDNIRAVKYLIDIFKHINYPLKIVGNIKKLEPSFLNNNYINISFVQLKDQNHLINLLNNTHINVLPTFQDTGIKLKLINALFNSRFCIVTKKMVEGNRLESLCLIANNKKDFTNNILKLIDCDYTKKEISKREIILKEFDTKTNALKIVQILNH